ncbi:MAG TPA: hypothetical protein VHT71_04310 [Methylomirabilota bacterium]|nr:hypothetical protein [Methylomirabilota bacterium]
MPIALGADPTMTTHAAYGVPKVSKESWDRSIRINPTGELTEPLPIWEANKALGQRDRFTPTSTDHDDMHRTWSQLSAHFLIDADGIIRWRFIEAAEGPAGLGMFPAEAEVVTAVRTFLP